MALRSLGRRRAHAQALLLSYQCFPSALWLQSSFLHSGGADFLIAFLACSAAFLCAAQRAFCAAEMRLSFSTHDALGRLSRSGFALFTFSRPCSGAGALTLLATQINSRACRNCAISASIEVKISSMLMQILIVRTVALLLQLPDTFARSTALLATGDCRRKRFRVCFSVGNPYWTAFLFSSMLFESALQGRG